MNKPVCFKIERVVDEAPGIKSFFFKGNMGARPGQFLMVWLPEVDEKPITVSSQSEDEFSILVCAVGPFSNKMHQLKIGDNLGFRGPYGNNFDLSGCKYIACVAGGYGAASLGFLSEEAVKKGIKVDFIIGAREKDLLLFEKRLDIDGVTYHASTDDGSCGHKGFCTQVLEKNMADNKYDKVFSVGPEMMMKKVVEICEAKDVPAEISLERYMKCGFGICGQCCVDDTGERVCVEGTIFDSERLKKVKEFGAYHRDATGKMVKF